MFDTESTFCVLLGWLALPASHQNKHLKSQHMYQIILATLVLPWIFGAKKPKMAGNGASSHKIDYIAEA